MRSSLKVIDCMVTLKSNSLPIKRSSWNNVFYTPYPVDGWFSSPCAFVFGVSKILVMTVRPLADLLKWKMRSPKLAKVEMWDIMEVQRKEGLAKRGDKKKLGGLIFFTVFEYKADIANTCNNSRIVQIGNLSQKYNPRCCFIKFIYNAQEQVLK